MHRLYLVVTPLFMMSLLTVNVSRSQVVDQDTIRSAEAPLEQLQELEARIRHLTALYETAEGVDKDVFHDQLRRRWLEHHMLLTEIAEGLSQAMKDGSADTLVTARVRSSLSAEIDFLLRHVSVQGEIISGLLVERAEAPRENWFELEERLASSNELLDGILEALAADLESAREIGLDVGEPETRFNELIADRAALLAARIEAAREVRSRIQSQLSRPGAPADHLRTELAAVQERIRWNSASLEVMATLLDARSMDSTAYRALVFEVTGKMGQGELSPKVLGSLVSKWVRDGRHWLRKNGGRASVRIVTMALILIATWLVARLTRNVVSRALRRGGLAASQLLQKLLVGAASKVIWALGLLVVLSMVGINIGPMLAGLGIAGFILGFALQDTLSNFASGLMIMIYRPFDVGDVVTAGGVTGKVHGLTLVSTVISTFDNQRIVLPNSKVWGDVINNVTAETTRRVDLVFGISYEDDIDKARGILESIVAAHPLVLADPEPVVRVHALGDSSVNFICRPWCKTEDYWTVYWDVTGEVKKRFDAEGVSIPFPQRDVHLYQHASEAGSKAVSE